jgi:ankyrin repeat protein
MNINDDAIMQLHHATQVGNVQEIKALLLAGIPVDSKESTGWTPLMEAACRGHEEVCKLLIEYNAQVHEKTRNGLTPLMLAAAHGHQNTCQLLIQMNAKIDMKDNDNLTPFMWAFKWKHIDACHLLIDEMLKPIKQNTDSIIALLGCNRKRKKNLLCLLPRDIAILIAQQLYTPVAQEKESLFAQIDAKIERNWTNDEKLRNSLLIYARERLKF